MLKSHTWGIMLLFITLSCQVKDDPCSYIPKTENTYRQLPYALNKEVKKFIKDAEINDPQLPLLLHLIDSICYIGYVYGMSDAFERPIHFYAAVDEHLILGYEKGAIAERIKNYSPELVEAMKCRMDMDIEIIYDKDCPTCIIDYKITSFKMFDAPIRRIVFTENGIIRKTEMNMWRAEW